MLSPNFLLHIAEGAEAIANMLHNEILKAMVRRIMARLSHGDDYLLTQTDKWQIETLQEAGFLLEDIQEQIAKRTGQGLKEIKKAFEAAGISTLKYDDETYKEAGLDPKPISQSPHIIRVLERNFEQTGGTWENLTRTTADAAQREFIQACDKAINLANSGTMSMQQAVMEAIDELARQGVGYVTYPSGHRDTIEVATLRAVRTGVNQTAAQITLKRMQEMDWDIILVSSHLGARNTEIAGMPYANHESWQGKFYSRTGKDKRFPDFVSSTGYGTGEGLCGWNCRHSFGSGDGEHNSFQQFDTEENKKRYEAEQEQRKKERKIRDYKRRYEVYKEALKADPNNKDLQKRVDGTKKKLIELNNDYTNYCKDNGLRPLEDRLKTGYYLKSDIYNAQKIANGEISGTMKMDIQFFASSEDRTALFGEKWEKASFNDALAKFAPNHVIEHTDTGKINYIDEKSGYTICYDRTSDYFRIESHELKAQGRRKRKYVDIMGNDVTNYTDKKGKIHGRSDDEYEPITHFKNIDNIGE